MSKLVIRNGRVIDPSQNLDRICDVGIEDGTIREVASGIDARGAAEFDASGLVVAPGFIDMHVHLREPGFEHAETIETGARAAAASPSLAAAAASSGDAARRMIWATFIADCSALAAASSRRCWRNRSSNVRRRRMFHQRKPAARRRSSSVVGLPKPPGGSVCASTQSAVVVSTHGVSAMVVVLSCRAACSRSGYRKCMG